MTLKCFIKSKRKGFEAVFFFFPVDILGQGAKKKIIYIYIWTICVVLCLRKKRPKHRCSFAVVAVFDRSNGTLRLLELDMKEQTGSK